MKEIQKTPGGEVLSQKLNGDAHHQKGSYWNMPKHTNISLVVVVVISYAGQCCMTYMFLTYTFGAGVCFWHGCLFYISYLPPLSTDFLYFNYAV